MISQTILHRITVPVMVHAFNRTALMRLMVAGHVTFIQRNGSEPAAMRSIGHMATQRLLLRTGDCIIRHGRKYPL